MEICRILFNILFIKNDTKLHFQYTILLTYVFWKKSREKKSLSQVAKIENFQFYLKYLKCLRKENFSIESLSTWIFLKI